MLFHLIFRGIIAVTMFKKATLGIIYFKLYRKKLCFRVVEDNEW